MIKADKIYFLYPTSHNATLSPMFFHDRAKRDGWVKALKKLDPLVEIHTNHMNLTTKTASKLVKVRNKYTG